MVQSRLDLIAPDITSVLVPSRARAIALMAVRAVHSLHPPDPLVREVVMALTSGDWASAQARRSELQALAGRLDDEYLQLCASDTAGNAVTEAFSRARALDALVMALESDETMGAKESLYEAHAALGSAGERLLAEVRSTLGGA